MRRSLALKAGLLAVPYILGLSLAYGWWDVDYEQELARGDHAQSDIPVVQRVYVLGPETESYPAPDRPDDMVGRPRMRIIRWHASLKFAEVLQNLPHDAHQNWMVTVYRKQFPPVFDYVASSPSDFPNFTLQSRDIIKVRDTTEPAGPYRKKRMALAITE